jgi:hypothetical protein
MKRIILAGVISIGVIVASLAPAQILRLGVEQINGVDLIDTRGSIWRGSGKLITDQGLSGDLNWQVGWQKEDLFGPAILWQITNQQTFFEGRISPGLSIQRIDVTGQFTSDFLEPILSKYDIFITGVFIIPPSRVTLRRLGSTTHLTLPEESEIFWSGGNVRYVLGNGLEQTYMPPLTARIRSQQSPLPLAIIELTTGNTNPLLTLTPDNEGYINIAVTKGFIELVGRKWEGSAQAKDVVIEVNRKVF